MTLHHVPPTPVGLLCFGCSRSPDTCACPWNPYLASLCPERSWSWSESGCSPVEPNRRLLSTFYSCPEPPSLWPDSPVCPNLPYHLASFRVPTFPCPRLSSFSPPYLLGGNFRILAAWLCPISYSPTCSRFHSAAVDDSIHSSAVGRGHPLLPPVAVLHLLILFPLPMCPFALQ